MKVVKSGSKYDIYSNDLVVMDQLEPKIYQVKFNERVGFWLQSRADFEINEKIYGVHIEKVQKVISSFQKFDRNLGVILSGGKGIGKSIFSKLLAQSITQIGIPVIIVESYIPDINKFIESIEQEVMILFDEFDKTFNVDVSENRANAQASMLSLFDGTSTGKKLFVVTCNELYRINDYLVNRPGRFHYHFRFESPSHEEIKEYLCDKLSPEYYPEIESVISFAAKVNLNYDCLRAIAFELNQGIPFKDAIKDLNIVNTESVSYNIWIHVGEKVFKITERIDIFSDDEIIISSYDAGYDISFYAKDMKFDSFSGVYKITNDVIDVESYNDKDDYSEEEYEELMSMKNDIFLTLRRKDADQIHYSV